MDIGKIIGIGVKKIGITKKELARILGVGPPAVTKWISGANNPPADKLIEMIKMLDLVEDFFPGYKKVEEPEEETMEDRVARIEKKLKEVDFFNKL